MPTVYGFKILCEISKGAFEISDKFGHMRRKICINWILFLCVIYVIFELWRH